MPEWATFVGFAFVVTSGLLVLSHASRGVVTDASNAQAPDDSLRDEPTSNGPSAGPPDATAVDGPDRGFEGADGRASGDASASRTAVDTAAEQAVLPKSGIAYPPSGSAADEVRDESGVEGVAVDRSTPSLLANVAVSQGLFGALLLVGAWYAEIPAWAFGVGAGVTGLRAVAVGTGLGVALYATNELSAAAGARFGLGVGDGERLRAALAPETVGGWALLLVVVLPVIAGFEELLFRGAIVGVVSAGYSVSPWAMAVVASGAFALGHGAQGRLGIVVTGALGFVLAAAFVVTGSLVVVIVAHYLVNALEFVVHEGLGVAWPPGGA